MDKLTKFRRRLKYYLLNKLETKLENICSVLQDDRYPESMINISIKQKASRINSTSTEVPKKYPVNIMFSWLGKIVLKFENQVQCTIGKAIMLLNLVSFCYKKNASRNTLRYCEFLP